MLNVICTQIVKYGIFHGVQSATTQQSPVFIEFSALITINN